MACVMYDKNMSNNLRQNQKFKNFRIDHYVFPVVNRQGNYDIIFKSKDKKYRQWYYAKHEDYKVVYKVDENNRSFLELNCSAYCKVVKSDYIANLKRYLISERGDVIDRERCCVLGIFYDKDTYHRTNLSFYKGNYKAQKQCAIHRLVAHAFCPRPEHLKDVPYGNLSVNHISGIKSDNSSINLEWCTNKENTRHALRNNLMTYGEDRYNSIFTMAEVRWMREHKKLHPETKAKWYIKHFKKDTSKEVVNKILRGEAYKENY